MPPGLFARLRACAEVGSLLLCAVYYYILTVWDVIFVDHSPLSLLNVTEIRFKAMARLWLSISPGVSSSDEAPPELDPDSAMSKVPSLLSTAYGDVLDLGPGTGGFTVYYDAPRVRSIYGAEPAVEFHPALKRSVDAAGLGEKSQVLACGAQKESLLPALHKAGVKVESGEGAFDTIVCVRVLCSVPDFPATLETLYDLLRPGGRFIICEHVLNPWRTSPRGSIIGRAFQVLFHILGWSFFVGDCKLNRDTGNLLTSIGNAKGGWEKVEVEYIGEWSSLPFATGVLVKKGGSGRAK
ncbi:MAG: hypothetical protein M1838_001718 [Thelocarpon superellum]|nr:MAG: hypothetical protein M1838_001718 [Thelocarpon superellum]